MSTKPKQVVKELIDLSDGVYEGETVDGVMHGYGVLKWNTGDVYEGEFRNDVFHGTGRYKWANGDVYEGDYVDEKQEGKGTLTDSLGTYVGEWSDDRKEGNGKMTAANGDVYEGQWRNDVKHGRGRINFSSGAMYEGEWVQNKYHGRGITRNPVGDIYEGEFIANRAHGRGSYRWADGTTYVGYFKDGVKHGEGCERKASGNWVAGNWINGEHDEMQPVHKVDPGQLEEHQRLLEEALGRLSIDIIKPKNPKQLIQEVPVTATTSVPQSPMTQYTEADFEGWQMMKMLGKGSFGAVYEAGLTSGKIVCVKIVELGNIAEEADLLKLRNEIAVMRRLQHPNIVQYYGTVEDKTKNTLNIFMEYVTGGTLNQFIKKFKVIPKETVRQWAYQMVNGVKYLHDCNIIHRDIKGDNILVTNDGILKLADFGCSKEIDDVCSKTHGCKTMVGTPYWMAPEVITCDSTGYGFKSDIWSVGCTMVEMVTGKPPWPECNSMWAAVYKIANSTGLPSEIPKDLSPDMMNFLEKCFERDPAKRASADDLLRHPWIQF